MENRNQRVVYLDYNATTPMHPDVVREMTICLRDYFGNPSTLYAHGQTARKIIKEARKHVADIIHASEGEIVFTSGGTEADNLAILGVARANHTRREHIITTQIEHKAVLNSCRQLENEGFDVTFIPVDEFGMVKIEELKNAIRDNTILVSVMHANNEVGTIQPILEIGKMLKTKNIYFHVDAVQTVGKLPINVTEMGIDLLSMSAHKIYGPKGVGALYVKKGTKINPIQYGGHQERGLKPGTENVAGIAGFGKAVEVTRESMEKEERRMRTLRDRLYEGIRKSIKHIRLNGHPESGLSNTLNVSFEFTDVEFLIMELNKYGIYVASGSACTTFSLTPSHVLLAMGIPANMARSAIRFSLGRGNTEEDIDYVLEVLPGAVERYRSIPKRRGKDNVA